MSKTDTIIQNGIVIRLIEDDTLDTLYTIGQYADEMRRRMPYYEVRYRSEITTEQREQMIQRVKEIAR
jgi:hypothetical protein